MKPIAPTFLALSILLAGASLLAIPTSVGGIFQTGLDNPEHEPLEAWFSNPGHWLPGAVLPGPWVSVSGRPTDMRLDNPGAIFGIQARSVTISRDDKGGVKEISVQYDKDTAKSAGAHLLSSLTTNVGAAIGAKGHASRGARGTDRYFEGKVYDVLLHPDAGGSNVVARLKLKGA